MSKTYESVIIEGAGGLFLLLNDQINVIEYVKDMNYPVILVSSSKLGSINHTLLSLEALKQKKIRLLGIVYNRFCNEEEPIVENSLKEIRKHLIKLGYQNTIKEVGNIDVSNPLIENFDMFFS